MDEGQARGDGLGDLGNSTASSDDGNRVAGVLLDELARLPERALVDEKRLASLLEVTTRTVRRMVARFELPPPIRLAGRSVWMVGHVLAHIQTAAERALSNAKRQARRLHHLGP